jgi:hypothetical protein
LLVLIGVSMMTRSLVMPTAEGQEVEEKRSEESMGRGVRRRRWWWRYGNGGGKGTGGMTE